MVGDPACGVGFERGEVRVGGRCLVDAGGELGADDFRHWLWALCDEPIGPGGAGEFRDDGARGDGEGGAAEQLGDGGGGVE